MKSSVSSVRIEMTKEEAIELRDDLIAMFSEIEKMVGRYINGDAVEGIVKNHPKSNELLKVLGVVDEMPF